MRRRTFLAGTGLATATTLLHARTPTHTIDIDKVLFQAWHDDGRLFCTFAAPTSGWLSVGFNNQHLLRNTRFVIGAVFRTGARVEEHVAVVPSHSPVQDEGLAEAIQDEMVDVQDGVSRLRFSWPHHFADTDNPDLSPGYHTYLMLAWSHEPDFDHHSAWRRHFELRL